MRLAIDIQQNPPSVHKPLPQNRIILVIVFYLVVLGLGGINAYLYTKKTAILNEIAVHEKNLEEAKGIQAKIESDTIALQKNAQLARDLGDWLSINTPAQALLLLISRQVEPNVSFTELLTEFEPGAANGRITIEIISSSLDASSRQIAKIQEELGRAGFRTINIESDQPTAAGWRFVVMLALPTQGHFANLVKKSP
jgi:hypothetical protein